MNKKLLVIMLSVFVVVGAGCAQGTPGPSAQDANTLLATDEEGGAEPVEGSGTEEPVVLGEANVDADADGEVEPIVETTVKEFTVTGGHLAFAPEKLTVKKGDKVRIVFKNEEGFHNLKLDEFGVATASIKAGAQEVVEFTADKAGSFAYYCSVGSHRVQGMEGVLVVE